MRVGTRGLAGLDGGCLSAQRGGGDRGVMAATVGIHNAASPSPRAAEAPFMEIPYVTPLAPYERIEVKRMDLPVSALIAAGFDVLHAPDTGASLRADVLFGQDGRAHAIRIVTKD